MAAKRAHPFWYWKTKSGLTYSEIAALCERLGRPTSAGYLKHIAAGRRWPDYSFGKLLSEDVTAGKVSVDDFMTFGRTKLRRAG